MPKRIGEATPEFFQSKRPTNKRFSELSETGIVFLYEVGKDFKRGAKIRHFIAQIRIAARNLGVGVKAQETKDGNVEAASYVLSAEEKAEMATAQERRANAAVAKKAKAQLDKSQA